jgi:thioesterase domain-containing protein
VVVPRQTCQSTSEFYDLVRREHVTVLNQTPGAFQKFIQVDELRGADLSLRVVIMSGENLCLPMLEPWFALHGDERPQLFNVYGITETTVFVTCQPLRATDRDPPTGSVIGKPFSGWQVFLFDEEHRPVADGELGEIYVGGAGVGVGYRNKPDLTRERFLSGTCFGLPNNRLYKSGDLARRLPNGDLVYAGRADHQVKIRGFRVELTEIQTVLARHPAIRDVAVVACADGTGMKQVVAYVVARGDMPPIRELHEFIGSQLPPYMIPALIVPLESLPLTVNGKVDRERLPPPFTKTSASSESTQPHLEGRQEQLRRLWERLLPVKSFGIDDNFFELGGNSLLGMQLCLEIEKELGVVVTPTTLVQQPTIRRLEETLDLGLLSAAASPLVCLQPKGHLSPFFCVHPIGGDVICFRLLSNYLGTDRPFYGLSVPKFSGRWESHTRIEDMAANYLTALQKIQPEGPYYLGGYSMGVYIALEMAQQLRASGRQVAFLGVLDDGPALLYQRLAWGPYAWARLLVNLPSWLRYDVYDKSFGELFAELSRKWRVLRRRMAFYQKSTVVDLEAILDISAFGQYQQKLIASHYQALLAYRPRPYAGEITLFRAKSQPLLTPCPYDLGWSALTVQPSNLKIHRVPGNHLTILTEPYIRVLAARLSTALADHTLSS